MLHPKKQRQDEKRMDIMRFIKIIWVITISGLLACAHTTPRNSKNSEIKDASLAKKQNLSAASKSTSQPTSQPKRQMPKLLSSSIDRDQLDRIFQAHQKDFEICYREERKRSPKSQGRIFMIIKIDKHGKVLHAKIEGGTLKSVLLNACLEHQVAKIEFPLPSDGETQVLQPFEVKEEKAKDRGNLSK